MFFQPLWFGEGGAFNPLYNNNEHDSWPQWKAQELTQDLLLYILQVTLYFGHLITLPKPNSLPVKKYWRDSFYELH
jgi:hypothetical protein